MTRTLIVLAGLLAATAARAEEPHETWLKYLDGTWKGKASNAKPSTVTWSLAPGRHAVLGTGHAEDTGETAEILGWEPDKKLLVHSWYSKTKSAYSRIEYTVESDRVLKGKDSGVMPDGRPYSGTITVRRVDDDKFTVEYSGKTKGDEEYKGSGTAVRVKPEGNAAAAKALRDWFDYFVGGVWTTTDAKGAKREDRWEWVLDKSFTLLTSKIDGKVEFLILGGPEPDGLLGV
jgi:hypothetical protein